MKKILLLLFASIFALVIAGCSQERATEASTKRTQTQQVIFRKKRLKW